MGIKAKPTQKISTRAIDNLDANRLREEDTTKGVEEAKGSC